MHSVTVTGWSTGFNKVEFNRLLRNELGWGLADAKIAVDRLLAGEQVSLTFADSEAAQSFLRCAGAMGAKCRSEQPA